MNTKALTLLVTGANGQLGMSLRQAAQNSPHQFIFTTRDSLPIENPDAINDFFDRQAIDICINAAAYTAVDKAETDIKTAMTINGDAVGYLAKACSQHKATLIHLSTDYVFDGKGTTPYKEDHPVSPVNAYGRSKLLGEEQALQHNAHTIILRTSWVYAAHGHNFLRTMLRLIREKTQISVVNDQQGCPTFSGDLAHTILYLIDREAYHQPGIYHYCNSGTTTWYAFACAIRELTGSTCDILPIPTSAYPTPALRPAYSVLDTQKIQTTFGCIIPNWEDALKRCLQQIS